MSFKEDFEDTYKVLQRVHNKLTTTASGDVHPVLQDDIVNLLCLLGSPLFSHLVDLDASLSQLSRLSRRPLHLSVDDFELDPTTGELILDRKSDQLVAGMAEESNMTDGKGTLESVDVMMEQLAQGRSIEVVELYKAENGSLGFGVVGLRSELRGELGIFVQEIQPAGIADKDGRLQDNDQILAINDQLLNTSITHQQAISVLQNARGHVRLLVARAQPSIAATRTNSTRTAATVDGSLKRSDDSLYTRCCRGNEQQQQTHSTTTTTDSSTLDMVLNTEWIQVEVITLVNDGTGLGFGIIGGKSTGVVVKTILPGGVADRDGRLHSGDHILQIGEVNVRGMGSEQVAAVLRQSGTHVHLIVARGVAEPSFDFPPYAPIIPTVQLTDHLHQLNEALLLHGADYSGHIITPDDALEHAPLTDIILPAEIHPPPAVTVMLEPEVEVFDVELVKDNLGLGITIAGFISDRPTDDLCGIFVRGIIEGSAAALDGRIQIHDQIVAVDDVSLDGFSNQQAVDVLRNTGQVIHLKLARHKFGSKYEQLLQAAASDYVSELNNSNQSAAAAVVDASHVHIIDSEDLLGDLPVDVEQLIVNKWQSVVGCDLDIIIAQVCKFKEGGGLGISLEGTVDVEDGVEVHPHHYIRSVLADGPVGLCGRLKAGDELLQVNDSVLYGRNHVEVVTILKDLPQHVRIVCARRHDDDMTSAVGHGSALFKAKSEQVLVADNIVSESYAGIIRPSHSLEPLSGLATWASTVVTVELQKGERGLGFSILDYQDPLNPAETVIVIRSLVPGGVAQLDGRLIPGDRLVFVNDVHLENATLDEAVQALKGAPHGRVVLGVTKPLPLPEIGESSTDDYLLDEQRLQCDSMSVSIPIFPINQTKSIYGAEMSSLNGGLNHIESQPLTGVQTTLVDMSSNNQPPSTLVYETEGSCYQRPLVELTDVSAGSTTQLKAAYRSPSLVESLHNPPSQLVRCNQEEVLSALVPAVSPASSSCPTSKYPYQRPQQTESLPPDVHQSANQPPRLTQQDFTALPTSLERTITVHKGTDALGMIVESIEAGVNGCVVKSLVDTDAVAKDGRILVGDYIVSVNGESLRRVSNVQARAILRRSSVISSDIIITFISSSDVSGEHRVDVSPSSCQTTSSVDAK